MRLSVLFFLSVVILTLIVFAHPAKSFAAACSTSTGGNWSAIAWSCGHTPTSADDVTLSAASPYTVTLDVASASVNSLTVNGASSNGTTAFALGANTLTVTGSVTIVGGSNNSRIGSVTVSGGTLTVGGNIVFSASAASRAVLNISGGTGSTVNLAGALTYSTAGTLTPGTTSIFNYNGSASQTIELTNSTYANVYTNNSAGVGPASGVTITTTNITGDLRVQSGQFTTNATITGNAGKTLQVANGASLTTTSTNATPISGFGTYSFDSGGTVTYSTSGNTIITMVNTSYGNLNAYPTTSGTYRFPAGSITISGNLTIGDGSGTGTVDAATNATTVTVNGNLQINTNATFQANATNTTTVKGNWTNTGTFTHNNGTVALTGTGAQAINSSTTFYNLQITGSTARTVTFTAGTTTTIAANGSLTMTGASGQLLTLQSSSSSDWNVAVNNTGTTVSVSYVSVSHSNAGGGKQIDASDGTSTNGGNNTNWNFGLDHYSVVVASPQTAGVCFTGTNTITAQDSSNTTITTNSSTVTMTTTGTGITFYTDSSCTPGNETTQYTLSSGVATMYIKTTMKQSGITITATRSGFTETGTSGSITVNPGSVTRLVVTLPGQTFTDGSGNSGSVTAQTAGSGFTLSKISATDDYFNVNTGYSGAKTLVYSGPANAPNNQAPSYTTSVSFTSGQSTTALTTTLYKAESTTITVTDTGSYGYASSSVTVNPGSKNNFLVSAGASQTAGSSFSVTITARDSWNNSLGSNYSAPAGTYTWSTAAGIAPSGQTPSIGTLSQSDFTNGVATKSVTLYKAESGVTFTASEPSASSVTGTSSGVTVAAGNISTSSSHSTVSIPASSAAISNVIVTITLKDIYDNPVTSYNGSNLSFTGTSTTYTVVSSPSTTNSSGVSTATLTWTDQGTKTVVVTDSGVGQLVSSPTITITEPGNTINIEGGVDVNGGVDIH